MATLFVMLELLFRVTTVRMISNHFQGTVLSIIIFSVVFSSVLKTWGFPSQFIKSTKVLMATPQGRRLGYHTPEQVSNQEPPDFRPCVLTITLLGGKGGIWIEKHLKFVSN